MVVDSIVERAPVQSDRLLDIRLVGPVRVIGSDGRSLAVRLAKAEGLLVLLATGPGLRRRRAWLQDKLWSESDPARGAASLRQTLVRLRRALGADGGCLQAECGWIGLDPAQVRIDLAGTAGEGPTEATEFAEGLDVRDPEFEEWLRLQRRVFAERMDAARGQSGAGSWRSGRRSEGGSLPRVSVALVVDDGRSSHAAALASDFAQELIAGLAGLRELSVVAATANAAVASDADFSCIARDRGLRYLVVLRVGGSAPPLLDVQLIDARSFAIRWSVRRELPAADGWREMSDLACATACQLGGLNGEIMRLERERVSREAFRREDAYELYVRAGDGLEVDDRANAILAEGLAERCTELDPKFARGWMMLNWRRCRLFLNGWGDGRADRIERERAIFRRAVELEPRDPLGLGFLALPMAKLGRTSEAIRLADRAADLAASQPDVGPEIALAVSAVAGQPRRALALVDRARWRNPTPPPAWGFMEARAAFFAGDHARALEAADLAPDCLPKLVFQGLAAAELGARAEAAACWSGLTARVPDFDLHAYARALPITHPQALAAFRSAALKLRALAAPPAAGG